MCGFLRHVPTRPPARWEARRMLKCYDMEKRPSGALFLCELCFLSAGSRVGYDFIFVSVLHFGHTTRIAPFPRGTESSCPQCLQRKYFVVLRLDHFFFASS